MQTSFIYDGISRFMHPCALDASRFTGKERDTESGLDYFGARYYASSMGRFMSPDPMSPMSKGKGAAFMDYIGQPQNWNKYAYARNNPMVLFDPDGKETQVAIGGRGGGGGGGGCMKTILFIGFIIFLLW
jgi:RHS repeat-associated protein